MELFGAQESDQLHWVVGLDACGSLIDSILTLLWCLPIDENPDVGLSGSHDRGSVEIPITKADDRGMEKIEYVANMTWVKGLRHQGPVRPKCRDLCEEIGVLRPEHHVISHVVTLNGSNQIAWGGLFGVDVDSNPTLFGQIQSLIKSWHLETRKLTGESRA